MVQPPLQLLEHPEINVGDIIWAPVEIHPDDWADPNSKSTAARLYVRLFS